MITLLVFIIGTITGYYWAIYRFRDAEKLVVYEEQLNPPHEWRRFIEANITTCFTIEQCVQCRKLIDLFDIKFRGKLHSTIFNDWMEKMWGHLDTKYKTIEALEERFAVNE